MAVLRLHMADHRATAIVAARRANAQGRPTGRARTIGQQCIACLENGAVFALHTHAGVLLFQAREPCFVTDIVQPSLRGGHDGLILDDGSQSRQTQTGRVESDIGTRHRVPDAHAAVVLCPRRDLRPKSQRLQPGDRGRRQRKHACINRAVFRRMHRRPCVQHLHRVAESPQRQGRRRTDGPRPDHQ